MRYLMMSGLVLLFGCQSLAQENVPVPAILDKTDRESQALIARAISQGLGGAPVTLSPTAFTQSSRLFIDNRAPGTGVTTGSNGKKLIPARVFELLTDGDNCLLKIPADEALVALPGVRCRSPEHP